MSGWITVIVARGQNAAHGVQDSLFFSLCLSLSHLTVTGVEVVQGGGAGIPTK